MNASTGTRLQHGKMRTNQTQRFQVERNAILFSLTANAVGCGCAAGRLCFDRRLPSTDSEFAVTRWAVIICAVLTSLAAFRP